MPKSRLPSKIIFYLQKDILALFGDTIYNQIEFATDITGNKSEMISLPYDPATISQTMQLPSNIERNWVISCVDDTIVKSMFKPVAMTSTPHMTLVSHGFSSCNV